MHIYFSASLHGKSEFLSHYQAIIEAAENSGNTVFSDHVMKVTPEEVSRWDDDTELEYHRQVINQIKKADALFVEVSYPSTSVGYLIAQALQANKPVVAFYQGNKEPHIFKSLEAVHDRFQVVRYQTLEDLSEEVPYMVEFINTNQDVRFNFFVSPSISHYLDWVSRSHRVPRSVYLRNLIDSDLAENSEYLERQPAT